MITTLIVVLPLANFEENILFGNLLYKFYQNIYFLMLWYSLRNMILVVVLLFSVDAFTHVTLLM